METLTNRIDFKVIFDVEGANPNGDPLNGNIPRQDIDGYGEVSDVAIKRKIRNRLQDLGQAIFVQSSDRSDDKMTNLKARFDQFKKDNDLGSAGVDQLASKACEKWVDVRTFGQVFAFTGKDNDKGVSIPVRGPVSIQRAKSVFPIDINTEQITKSVNGQETEKANAKSPDTMGTKYFVEYGVYSFNGSISTQLSEKTGFSNKDADLIKQALETLFDNDESSARPAGSMRVRKVYWWVNESTKFSPYQVHNFVKINVSESNPVKSWEDIEITDNTPDEFKNQQYVWTLE